MRYTQSNADAVNDGTISDGVSIEGTKFRLTNTEAGRITGGVVLLQGGNTLQNDLGGIIRGPVTAQGVKSYAVTGSDGADRIVNAGLIAGYVSLGGGDDVFVDRDGNVSAPILYGSGEVPLDFGAGDDTYRVEGSRFLFLAADGGAGRDRLVMANTHYQIDGKSLVGFEEAVFEEGGNIQNFSSFSTLR